MKTIISKPILTWITPKEMLFKKMIIEILEMPFLKRFKDEIILFFFNFIITIIIKILLKTDKIDSTFIADVAFIAMICFVLTIVIFIFSEIRNQIIEMYDNRIVIKALKLKIIKYDQISKINFIKLEKKKNEVEAMKIYHQAELLSIITISKIISAKEIREVFKKYPIKINNLS